MPYRPNYLPDHEERWSRQASKAFPDLYAKAAHNCVNRFSKFYIYIYTLICIYVYTYIH